MSRAAERPPRDGRQIRDLPPGRDRRAVLHPGRAGSPTVSTPRSVVVVGGGIAGLAAACVLAERGVVVTVLEGSDRLGGRVAAWPLGDGRSMSRGFHAFFRQYYNLRRLLQRTDPGLQRLRPVPDYPLLRPDGLRDSFAALSTRPPFNVLDFVRRSPTFTAASLLDVDVRAALELLRTRFPGTHEAYDGESAAHFLDRLRFPRAARDLALEVFARSFFCAPEDFAAGELVSMFHTYFLGSAEGLLFDVPDDDYDAALWAPLGRYLRGLGVQVRLGEPALRLEVDAGHAAVETDRHRHEADAVVLATDPRAARDLARSPTVRLPATWTEAVSATRNAPPFTVVRLWFDGRVRADRPAFTATSGFGPLDNISVLERFEATAARARGSVVELHAYACPPEVLTDPARCEALVGRLRTELERAFPEVAALAELRSEVLVRDDCPMITPAPWAHRPGVTTPSQHLVLAGDWVRTELPVALMERAATTGVQAANALLQSWGVAGEDVWTVPLSGLLARTPRVRGERGARPVRAGEART